MSGNWERKTTIVVCMLVGKYLMSNNNKTIAYSVNEKVIITDTRHQLLLTVQNIDDNIREREVQQVQEVDHHLIR